MNYLIIGGSKSGKSEVGEKIALTLSRNKVIYIATMNPYDKEDEDRIERHKKSREGLNFKTLEVTRDLDSVINTINCKDTVLIDSITSLLTNEMFNANEIIKNPSHKILSNLKQIMNNAKNVIIVSDYIFNDAIQYDEITENFKKELAIINRGLANYCENVIECSFGLIKYIKHEEK
ncbi:bifunctional adenosylcobinamide kinase/adenosylcobinamide-phosphate guanylyltransferase [Clostridium beijerinckii]|uniref:bifunctional adenosylcobinamide kinase/adenosylcobinamide-phosphate guanylyltransferase n=1 Tax=Clostridium beijerinckii TaxID=1520 RepID=UPI001494D5F3|nr:bifunctional adenosylcobinamide kinase/adenosylcobinamide-phosphate guanylyltransferase [Clostridium beijerinckii]NOW02857.1 adenosylcobinamide kinase/adenosylcobinamide-phosphate guanylyltransferase [Clostridium beijerinckii]NYC04002.1 adenosylcobinamide kinase/adenosylcobinamide-phosphate guanylyltransferase [Clostridium beijerinckii]